jgi:TolB protein
MRPFLRLAIAAAVITLSCHGGGPRDDRVAIAVVPFRMAAGSAPLSADVAASIRDDLAATDRFAPLADEELPARPTDLAEIRFDEWRRAAVDYVVVGTVSRVHDGGHEIEFRLVDTAAEREVVGYLVPSAPDELRKTASEIAEIIRSRIPGAASIPNPRTEPGPPAG